MRTYSTRTETKTVTFTNLERVVCDLCGAESPDPNGGVDSNGAWTKSCYEVREVVMRKRIGESYPEGASIEVTEIDLCPDCFDVLIGVVSERAAQRGAVVTPTVKNQEW